MSQDLKKLADTLVSLSVKDVNELATILKEEHGIEPAAAAPVMMAAAGEAPAAAEEKTSFDVILKGVGSGSKLNIIKAVKAITGLGLPDSKALVDGAPKPVKEGVAKDEAENVRKQLEEAGAEVEVK